MALVTRFQLDDSLQPWLCADDGTRISLKAGEELDVALSTDKYCTGFTKKGVHFDCPSARQAKGRQCRHCAKQDSFSACLKCDGSICLSEDEEPMADCAEKGYCVYLASFGYKIKAGTSREDRLTKRWIEQGADYAVKIFGGVDGRKARQIEAKLVEKGFLNYVTAREKVELLGKKDADAISKAVGEAAAMEEFGEFKAAGETAADLSSHYPNVSQASETSALRGLSMGTKGSLLLLEGNKAFLLNDAVGRKIMTQTLGSF